MSAPDPLITQLIDKRDTCEIVIDEIAARLVVEVARQQELAVDAGKNPANWGLRIFVDRATPWSVFQEDPKDTTPIVHISMDSSAFDKSSSNVVERQHSTTTYWIDCYGYGTAKARSDDYVEGHDPGDAIAAEEVRRAVRLVRNILMSGALARLGLMGTVWDRWIPRIQYFKPEENGQSVERVEAARIYLEVDFNELSPQVEGAPLQLISVTLLRAETGQVFFEGLYEDS